MKITDFHCFPRLCEGEGGKTPPSRSPPHHVYAQHSVNRALAAMARGARPPPRAPLPTTHVHSIA